MTLRILPLCCSALLAFGHAAPAVAEAGPPEKPTAPQPSASATTSEDDELQSFLDSFIDTQMRERQIPGAAITVVKDGEILLARGYGLADVDNEIPVDPAATRFSVASVSKLFTATAVMQLSERGLLSLDDDVSQHLESLDFERQFPEPLRVFHLLTHTSGVEDELLFSTRPEQFGPPGDLVSYSNTGINTAGQVVAAASGLAFEDYVAVNVLGPLGMTSSSFVPLPEDSAEAPVGYVLHQGRHAPNRRPFTDVVPAGSLSSTATDMARFMIAHLQGGRFKESSILQPESVAAMHARQAGNHPGAAGVTLGFWESTRSGARVLEHKGDATGFHAALALIPEAGAGVFFVCNRQAYGLSDELIDELVARFFPGEAEEVEPRAGPPADAARYSGSYRWLRSPRKGLGKVLGSGLGAAVRPASEGAIHVSFGGLPIPANTLTRVEEGLFRAPSGGEFSREVAFRTTPEGRVTHLFAGPFAFERVAWYESAPFLALAGLAFLATFLLGATAGPLAALVRRLRRKSPPARSRLARVAPSLATLLGALNLGFLVGLVALLTSMAAQQSFSISPPLNTLLALPPILALLTAAVVVCAALLWRRKEGSLPKRTLYSLYALVSLAFLPYLAYFDLLGFDL